MSVQEIRKWLNGILKRIQQQIPTLGELEETKIKPSSRTISSEERNYFGDTRYFKESEIKVVAL